MRAPRVITLTVEQDGSSWTVATDPESAEVNAGDKIVWEVIAPAGVTVDVTKFRRTSTAPLTILSTGLTKSGQKIRGRLPATGFAPVYKYEVWITDANGNEFSVDPDIQVKE